jgi:hypothetical protein
MILVTLVTLQVLVFRPTVPSMLFWFTEVPGSANPEAEALSLLIFGLIGLTASRQLNPRRATRCIMSQNI